MKPKGPSIHIKRGLICILDAGAYLNYNKYMVCFLKTLSQKKIINTFILQIPHQLPLLG